MHRGGGPLPESLEENATGDWSESDGDSGTSATPEHNEALELERAEREPQQQEVAKKALKRRKQRRAAQRRRRRRSRRALQLALVEERRRQEEEMRQICEEHGLSTLSEVRLRKKYDFTGRQLGCGSSADVHEGKGKGRGLRSIGMALRGKSSGRYVACKRVGLEYLAQCYAEVVALSTLEGHRNIPKLLHAVKSEDDSAWLLYMPLARGGDLLQRVEGRGPLSEPKARPIFFQVLKAVNYAHLLGIVHRDIKLDNILFVDEEQTNIWLADWGISSRFSHDVYLKEDCGSLHYAPPEILMRSAYYGPSVDYWALGVLLYTMVAGYFPYGGTNPAEKKRAFLGRLRFPPRTSVLLRDLILKLLQFHPYDRISAEQALQHPWITDSHKNTNLSISADTFVPAHARPYIGGDLAETIRRQAAHRKTTPAPYTHDFQTSHSAPSPQFAPPSSVAASSTSNVPVGDSDAAIRNLPFGGIHSSSSSPDVLNPSPKHQHRQTWSGEKKN